MLFRATFEVKRNLPSLSHRFRGPEYSLCIFSCTFWCCL